VDVPCCAAGRAVGMGVGWSSRMIFVTSMPVVLRPADRGSAPLAGFFFVVPMKRAALQHRGYVLPLGPAISIAVQEIFNEKQSRSLLMLAIYSAMNQGRISTSTTIIVAFGRVRRGHDAPGDAAPPVQTRAGAIRCT